MTALLASKNVSYIKNTGSCCCIVTTAYCNKNKKIQTNSYCRFPYAKFKYSESQKDINDDSNNSSHAKKQVPQYPGHIPTTLLQKGANLKLRMI